MSYIITVIYVLIKYNEIGCHESKAKPFKRNYNFKYMKFLNNKLVEQKWPNYDGKI